MSVNEKQGYDGLKVSRQQRRALERVQKKVKKTSAEIASELNEQFDRSRINKTNGPIELEVNIKKGSQSEEGSEVEVGIGSELGEYGASSSHLPSQVVSETSEQCKEKNEEEPEFNTKMLESQYFYNTVFLQQPGHTQEDLTKFHQAVDLMILVNKEKYQKYFECNKLNLNDMLNLYGELFLNPIMLHKKDDEIINPEDYLMLMKHCGMLYYASPNTFQQLVVFPGIQYVDILNMIADAEHMKNKELDKMTPLKWHLDLCDKLKIPDYVFKMSPVLNTCNKT